MMHLWWNTLLKRLTVKSTEFKTARCVLKWDDRYLLVVHRGQLRGSSKWGLPGGHVEPGENGAETIRRELQEELSINPSQFKMIGDFYYKRHYHRIYGARNHRADSKIYHRELLKIAWFPLASAESWRFRVTCMPAMKQMPSQHLMSSIRNKTVAKVLH